MEEHKALLQSICEARGGKNLLLEVWNHVVNQPPFYRDAFLRGLLMEPETLKAWFGEIGICGKCGCEKYEVDKEGDYYCSDCSWFISLPSWQYHGTKMVQQGLSLKEMLEYYKNNK